MTLNGESIWGAILKAIRDWWRGKRRRGLDPHEYRVLAVLALCGLAGCTSTYVAYDTPNGSKLSVHRRSLLTKAEMPSVKFNPDGSVEMVGYKNDQTEGVTEAIKSACKGAVEGAVGK